MKKYTAIIIVATAIILLTQTNLLNDLLYFLLVGAIPGTTQSVPSSVMLSAIIVASGIIILSFPAVRHFVKRVFSLLRIMLTDVRAQLIKHRLGDA